MPTFDASRLWAQASSPSQEPAQRSHEAKAVYRLTETEIEEMRLDFQRSHLWARAQLARDPELKHLGPAGSKMPTDDPQLAPPACGSKVRRDAWL